MRISSLTDVGMSREMNQDYLYTSEDPIGSLECLFIVADGMGGHNAGEFASRSTIETIVSSVQKHPKEETDEVLILKEAITEANERVRNKAKEEPEFQGMGTTVVAATLRGSTLTVANVGDSRLYLFTDTVQQITKDHSLVQEMVRLGELTEAEAVNHPDKNIITRAIGAAPEVVIDFFEVEVTSGNHILLCSDGLSNMVDDKTMLEVMNGDGDIVEKCERLMTLANEHGGKDNITLIVIEV